MTFKKFINFHLVYFIECLLTIPLVIFIFKFIHPKNTAAIFAGTSFISLSLIIISLEVFKSKRPFKNSPSFWGALIFLLFFSLPMLVVRLLNFNTDFEKLNILFVPANEFHKLSNYGFLFLMLCVFWGWLKEVKKS